MDKREPKWFKFLKPLLIFVGCMAVATAIELATSYALEALTGSWPWQTYSDYAINFQGRIALPVCTLWVGRFAFPLYSSALV